MRITIFTTLFLLAGFAGLSQHSSMAYRTLADSLYRHHHYQHAADFYVKALKKSPHQGNIMIQLANCYHKINRITESEQWYLKAKINRGAFSIDDQYQLAEVLIRLNKRDQADSVLQHLLLVEPNPEVAKKALANLRTFDKYYLDSASIQVHSLPINTPSSEFAPAYYKNGIIYSSSKHEGALKKKSHWDNAPFHNLYYAQRKGNNQFDGPTLFEDDLNSRHHDGPAMFYAGDQKMIVNRNQRVKAAGRDNVYEWRPGLYDAEFDSIKLTWKVTPLPFNVSSYSYLHPSISEDGTTLYFSSDKPGGYGGTDIYRSIRSNGEWGPPFNLGPVVNTAEDEAFPFFIDATLYFTSRGHGGLGGLDIFQSEWSGNVFTTPVNLGYPINSTADDFSLVTDATQLNGYFASSRPGNDDLFSFKKTPILDVLAMGLVTNRAGKEIDGFRATVIDENGSRIPVEIEKGKITFHTKRGENYKISVAHEDYQDALKELSIPLTGPNTESFTVILEDRKVGDSKLLSVDTEKATTKMYIKSGETLKEITEKDLKKLDIQKSDRTNLRNIYFDFDMANLDTDDKVYLDELTKILDHDGTYKILIAGHADDRGDDDYNVRLSKRRVEAVMSYLVSKGINKNRIIQKAYGESLPEIPCYAVDCSEDDHQKNRRAEFVLRYDAVSAPAPPLN